MRVAGIDSSTQNCKVVVCDAATGEVLRTGSAPHPQGTEVAPEQWWLALTRAAAAAGGLDDVDAVSIAGQQHGLVALDDAGRVIRPALLWNDTRSSGAADALIAEWGSDALVARTGLVPVASFTIAKLRWLRDAEPERAARVAAVALPHDWLSWRLAGYGPTDASPLGPDLSALWTDRSDASGTGYWSADGGYDANLLRSALGHDAVLPRVAGPLERVADTVAHPDAGIRAGTVIGAGAGDNAAGALGLGAGTGDAVVSIGTSGTVFGVSDTPPRDATGTVAGFADATGAHLPLIATLNAARVLDSVAALLGVDHDTLGELALTSPPGAAGLTLRPYFAGERTPNLPDATATLFGMTLDSTRREHLARAAVEGLLCGLADGLEAVRHTGLHAERLLLIGGGARSRAVQEIAAQVFDVPVLVLRPAEYVALGAARQVASALAGTWAGWAVAAERRLPADPVPAIRAQYRSRP